MCSTRGVSVVVVLMCVVVVFLSGHSAEARPSIFSRQRRVTDHRIQELNLLNTLQKLRNSLVTQPVGFNKVDINRIGRRRRSAERLLWKLVEDTSPEDEREREENEEPASSSMAVENDAAAERNEETEAADEMLTKLLQQIEQSVHLRHLPVRLPE